MRPRNVLLLACPWLSRDEASDVLRNAGGDVESAKKSAAAARRHRQKESELPAALPTAAASGRDRPGHPRPSSPLARAPPRHSASVHNLSDRRYCCVWSVEVYEDGYRPDVARALLATVARQVNPILRARGWRVKRLIESASPRWIGLCTANGRTDADAASTNIQLNVRGRPDRQCRQFRSVRQLLAVMLHEITHTSIGLEDIHPPAFYELLDQIKIEYKEKLAAGEVELEIDDYGCNGQFISATGELASVSMSASDVLTNGMENLDLMGKAGSEGDCGASKTRRRRRGKRKPRNRNNFPGGCASKGRKEKKRPLLKGSKMVDKRTTVGKAAMAGREKLTARELAARAALTRLNAAASTVSSFSAAEHTAFDRDLTCDSSSDDDRKRGALSSAGKGDVFSDGEEGEGSDALSEERDLSCEDEDGEDSIEEPIVEHTTSCVCRSCDWSKLFLLE